MPATTYGISNAGRSIADIGLTNSRAAGWGLQLPVSTHLRLPFRAGQERLRLLSRAANPFFVVSRGHRGCLWQGRGVDGLGRRRHAVEAGSRMALGISR